ncbi:MAG: PAS domain-containing protein [Rhodospirillaceae bacterium]|nr:PAS domain-containing protein [Rhodospirillaceae bacterium]
MGKGLGRLFRDLAVLAAGVAALLAVTGPADWPVLLVVAALGLCGLAFVILRHLPPHRSPGQRATADAADVAMPGAIDAGGALRAILNALPDPVLILDRGRRIVLVNAAARSLLGSDLENRSLLSVLRQPVLLTALEALSRGEAPPPLELAAIGGRSLTAELVPVDFDGPLPPPVDSGDESGGPHVLIVFHDISGQRRMESLRSDFVANVSHELKTPLATLIGFLETLKGPARDDAAARARFLDIMLTEARRMSRIVADLLSLSRIELNEHQPPEGRADLKRIVGSIIDGLALKAKQRGIVVRLVDAERLPVVPGDADELTQVLQNLIDNAVKYSREQAIVTIRAEIVTDPALLRLHLPPPRSLPAAVKLAISDQSPGIPREHIPRLTERFYRVDSARSREMGGTGLGLAIVKHIVNRHRGKLEIESVLGEGSVFTVYLPLDAVPSALSPAAATGAV